MVKIIALKSADELIKATAVMHALRPQLNEDNIAMIIGGMITRGYNLLGLEENGLIVAACGYRFTEHLHWGKAIYIDDLSTLSTFRKKGYARKLLDEVVHLAEKNECREVHLDSGCGPNRYDAHRMYLSYGFNITSHHFAFSIKK